MQNIKNPRECFVTPFNFEFFFQGNSLRVFIFFACNWYPFQVRMVIVLLYSVKSEHKTAHSFCCPQIALKCRLVLENLDTVLLYRFIDYCIECLKCNFIVGTSEITILKYIVTFQEIILLVY